MSNRSEQTFFRAKHKTDQQIYEKYSISLIIRETLIKPTVRLLKKKNKIPAGEDMERTEPSCTVSGNVK